jgi:uncharacterized membrane protein
MTLQSPPPPSEAPESLTPPKRIFQLPAMDNSAYIALLRDHAFQSLFIVAFVISVSLFIYLLVRFDALPDPMPLHFDAFGQPDRIEAKNGIFALPTIGLGVLVINTALGVIAHLRQRAAALLLAVGALAVEILMWVAMLNIIGGLV